MGVYIKGMEMPESCYKCPLRRRDGMDIVCPVAHERFSVADVNILEYRLNNCPLGPVPPHGRLIDADALTVKLQRHREYHSDGSKSGAAISNGIGQCLDIINGKECTTIIPAEEGET